MQRIGDSQAQVGYSVAGGSGGRVTPCAVCTMHKETRCHTPVLRNETEASIRVPRMFKSHVRTTIW
jgi:hypothetical protein